MAASTKIVSIICLMGLILLSTSPNSVLSTPTTHGKGKCPRDTLKFGVCGNLPVLREVIGIGTVQPSRECCSLVKGLVEMDAAMCFCSAIRANVLGMIRVDMSVAVSGLLNGCGKKMPRGFVCA